MKTKQYKKQICKSKQKGSLIKSIDMFGQPIALTFKGEDTFKNKCGGCVSLFIIILMLFCFMIKTIFFV